VTVFSNESAISIAGASRLGELTFDGTTDEKTIQDDVRGKG
jgi:hypothetical protein